MTNVHTELDRVRKIDEGTVVRLFEDPDLLVVCGFSIVGLLLTVCLIHILSFDDLIEVLALAN